MPSFSGVFTLQAQMQAIAAGLWTAPPGAPTIGTATGGNASASVTFTAPAYTGNPAGITSYTVISSPGGFTGTGASSPITVSGLSNGTAYTFTVTATGASGTGSASEASNSVTPVAPPSVIGEAYGGGFYAGQIGVSSVATHYLIVGPVASAQAGTTLAWKTTATSTSGTSSDINGPANSAAMNDASHPAAEFCEGLTIGGYSDWYLPAKNELEVCYYNLKPNTNANNTASGTNPNAVPSRTGDYTTGTPAQTSATDFQTSGAQAFLSVGYWTSTENSSTAGWRQIFAYGYQGGTNKTNGNRVRAIRRIAV